jgi:hypothetical protein
MVSRRPHSARAPTRRVGDSKRVGVADSLLVVNGKPLHRVSACGALSKLHNVTDGRSDLRLGERSSTLTTAVGGSLVTVRTPRRGELPPPPKGTAKREAITEWSSKSRMALKCALAKLKRDALGQALFLTLTYPGEFPAPDDHAVYKNHLRVFNQALARAFGASGLWKLEFQTRGAAHFHLIVFGLNGQDIEALREWGFKADDQWVPEGAVSWHWCAGAKGLFPMPRRYRARNNATARLIVDPDRFRVDVERARGLGLFDRPGCEAGRAPAKTDKPSAGLQVITRFQP